MASRRMTKLTDRQRDAVLVLRGNPGVWMTAKDLFNKMCEVSPWNSDSSHVGSLMRLLPQKDQRVEIDDSTSTTRYRWIDYVEGFGDDPDKYAFGQSKPQEVVNLGRVGDTDWTPIEKPIRAVSTYEQTRVLDDDTIVLEALMHYAKTMAATNAMNAMRAAFLAGRGGFFGKGSKASTKRAHLSVDAPTRAIPDSLRDVGPTEGIDESEESRKPAEMPPDMTYDEFQSIIHAAYKNLEFTWEQGAKRAGMNADYFMRVCKGDATPSLQTRQRVWGAIFDAE